jgi:Na+-transporting NADH:ubiquinone oxidoreductase subunit C
VSDSGWNGDSWWARFSALPNDNPAKTVVITLAVALAGSVLVAGSAVLLRPLQLANKEAERPAHIAEIVQMLPDPGDIQVEARVVDLATGDYVSSIDPVLYDQRQAAKDPDRSVEIPGEDDIAGLGRRARFAAVYLVRQAGEMRLVVLPVRGRGYGSMLYGYLGLFDDMNTVAGLTFYEHAETPGLGALIDDPEWKNQWHGKVIWDGPVLMLGVGTGRIEPGSPEAKYQVDGLTGATWTAQGVTNLLHYWLGEHGYGPYLEKLKQRGG